MSKGFAPVFRLACRAIGDPHHDEGPRSPGVRREAAQKHLSFPERPMAAAPRAQESNFRDWTEVRDWAAGIAAAPQS